MIRSLRQIIPLSLCVLIYAMQPITTYASPSKEQQNKLSELSSAAEHELLENILPFWLKHAPSSGPFAFQGELDAQREPRPQALRGMLLSARLLYTFSAAHRMYPANGYLELADKAYLDLEQRFWDVRHGGYYWSANADGSINDRRKQVYGQSFAIYGLAEYSLASGRPEPLQRAIQLFHLLEKHSHDARNGGYIEAYNEKWERPEGMVFSVIGPDFEKSQNTHLHLMEAFSALHRAYPDPLVRTRLREVTELMITKIPTPNGKHLQLYFDADWTPRSDRLSYGHDIEANWLLCDAADTLEEADFTKRVHRAALQLAQATRDEGLDADGGIWNEADPKGLTNAGKDWWAQAEGAVGFLNAYQISGDDTQLDAALRVWAFAECRLVDRKDGGWFWGVKPDGITDTQAPKLSMWKCPYHNARACMELIRRVRALGQTSAAH